jgi:hypothetical protein
MLVLSRICSWHRIDLLFAIAFNGESDLRVLLSVGTPPPTRSVPALRDSSVGEESLTRSLWVILGVVIASIGRAWHVEAKVDCGWRRLWARCNASLHQLG